MANVQYNPQTGQYFTINPLYANVMGGNFGGSLASNPKLWQGNINNGIVKIIGGPSSGASATSPFNTASISTAYTPNQYTAKQLAGYGSGGGGGNAMPAWMHQAFSKKMAGMNAPSNGPLPYQLTSSSFRGMPSGKAAPAGGK